MAQSENITAYHLKHGNALVTLHDYAAHITRWRSQTGTEWLFTSRQSHMQPPKAIRGGVPIIFPQFNERGGGQRHGFARNVLWQFQGADDHCLMTLVDDENTQTLWPHRFRADFEVAVSGQQLRMDLTITNTDAHAFEFSCALHTYLDIGQLPATRLQGLHGLSYWDNNGSAFSDRNVFDQQTLDFDDAIDRVYFGLKDSLELSCPKGRLRIEQTGFEDTVVWNPGRDAAAQMADFADDEYLQMLCVEAAQIDRPVTLAPGESWKGSQILSEL